LGGPAEGSFTFKANRDFVGFSVTPRGNRGGKGGEGGLTRPYLLLHTSDFHWTDAAYPARPGIPVRSPWYRGGALPPNNSSHIIAFIAH